MASSCMSKPYMNTEIRRARSRRRAGSASSRAPTTAWAGRAEPLDQVEHGRPQRVGVLEDKGDRVVARQRVDQREEAGLHVVDERRLLAPLSADAEEQPEPLDDPIEVALHAARFDQLAQAAPDRLGRIGRFDEGKLADDRGGGGEGRAAPEAPP